jgi:DNA-binding CsgD family transcriptional regulator
MLAFQLAPEGRSAHCAFEPCNKEVDRADFMLPTDATTAAKNAQLMRQTPWAEGMLDAFERVGWGALLIGADGCVISLNDEARRHVGSEITLAQGQIAATHRTANAELKHRIAATLSADNGPLPATRGGVLLPRRDGRPVMAYVISIAEPGGGSPPQAKAILVLIDSDKQSEPTEEILREGFGLTAAETRIAIGFARGRDLHEIANDQGLSIETVRKCFKAVLAKTNTSRQAELAMLLARLAQRPGEQSAVRSLRTPPASPVKYSPASGV